MKRVLYFAPAIFGMVFYCLLAVFSGFGAIHPAVWLCIAMLFVSAVLLARKKWFGCIPGVLVGVLLIWMSFQTTGQVIDIERPLGIALTVFYIFCGYGTHQRFSSSLSGRTGFTAALVMCAAVGICFLTDPTPSREFSMSGDNVSNLNPEDIVERILDVEDITNSGVHTNAMNFSLQVDSDFNWAGSQTISYFYKKAQMIYKGQLRVFPDEDRYFLTEPSESQEQESIFLLRSYLEAIKYLPQKAIQAMAPADQYIIQQREEGRPSDYDRVITYTSEGEKEIDGWYIHLQIQPLHKDGDQYRGTGDEVIDLFYGHSMSDDAIFFDGAYIPKTNVQIKLTNLHNGKSSKITERDDIDSIISFIQKIGGGNPTSSKGYYGGTYELQVLIKNETVFSIGFGDDQTFNYGDYGDGYPTRYELRGVTKNDVIRFLSKYDTSGFDWGLSSSVMNAALLEINDGYYLVEPIEGSSELSSASRIEVAMRNMAPSPEPQVGDILEIEYDGYLQETYPARISNPYMIKVIQETETWDRIPMVMVNGTLYLDTGKESTVMARCGMMDGEITSQVPGNEEPAVDDQSNFGIGYGYQYGPVEGTIEIFMNDKWWVFATEKARKEIQFPSEETSGSLMIDPIVPVTVKNLITGEMKIVNSNPSIRAIQSLISSEWWAEGNPACDNDYKITVNDECYWYHSDCGTLNDINHDRCISLNESQKAAMDVLIAVGQDSDFDRYWLTVGEDGVKRIDIKTAYSSGACENADGSLYNKGDRIWLESLDGFLDLRGVSFTALDEQGQIVWQASIPAGEDNEGFTHLRNDDWNITNIP